MTVVTLSSPSAASNSSITVGQGRRSHRIIGGHKRKWGSGGRSPPAGSRGGAPVGDLEPPEAEAFFVKLHIIFALKYDKQQLLLLLDKE